MVASRVVIFALETQTDFLAVTDHRLILSRARDEWSRLRQKGIQSVWGIISLRGALVTQLAYATVLSQKFYHQ